MIKGHLSCSAESCYEEPGSFLHDHRPESASEEPENGAISAISMSSLQQVFFPSLPLALRKRASWVWRWAVEGSRGQPPVGKGWGLECACRSCQMRRRLKHESYDLPVIAWLCILINWATEEFCHLVLFVCFGIGLKKGNCIAMGGLI